MINVIIDTDPGTDDSLALMMALNEPTLNILGLTTIGGNASLAHTTSNALRLLQHLGKSDVPIFKGCARPLQSRFTYAYDYHGPTGLTVNLPPSKAVPKTMRAADYIISQARSLPGNLIILALGPLTNIATAIIKDPRVKDWIKGLVVMGGALKVPGNITPHAEFNVYNDPLAADLVVSSGIPLTLVGLDICNQVYISREDLPWPSGLSRSENLARAILNQWFANNSDSTVYKLFDPMALVALLYPNMLAYKHVEIIVETQNQDRKGEIIANYGIGKIRVANDVRVIESKEKIRNLLRDPSN